MTEKSTHEQTGENNFSIKVEHFIIDLKEKKVSLPYRYTKDISLDDVEHLPFEYEDLDDFKYDDSFPDVLNAEIQGKELTLKHDAKDNLYLFANNVRIMKTNANHEITELYLPTTKEIPDHCLMYNKTLEKFSAPNVQRIGAAFLCNNISLTDLNAPKLEIIDSFILRQNKKLKKIDLPSVSKIGYAFLENNEDCQSVNLFLRLEVTFYAVIKFADSLIFHGFERSDITF